MDFQNFCFHFLFLVRVLLILFILLFIYLNFISYLCLLIEYFMVTTTEDVGFYVAMIGVAFYGASLLFALATLPVELDASRRAKQMLLREHILTESEIPAAKEVLSAAALTYLASLLTSLVYFLRFLFYVLTLFGRRD